MSNYFFHPYLRWLHDRSQGGTPGFSLDQDGLPPQPPAQRIVNFSAPESEVLLPSAPRIGLARFVAEQLNEIPGFRIGLRDVPGFNLDKDDLPHPERTWPDGMAPPAPEYPDIGQTWTLPPGVKEPEPPPPPPPEWLHNLLTMPVPQPSTAFDPRTGRRIVPYEPLVGPVRSYLTTNQNAPGTVAASGYMTEMGASPALTSVRAPAMRHWPSLATPEGLSDSHTHLGLARSQAANVRPLVQEARWASLPQPLKNDQAHVQQNGVDPGDPWRADVQELQQETPLPQEHRTQPNVPRTIAGRNLAGIRLTPRVDTLPIDQSVYNPDLDPGYDDLFDLVQDIRDNKTQGDKARDVEADRIKKSDPKVGLHKEIRLYAKDVPGLYMVIDIAYRRNGSMQIVVLEVKSGTATLTSNQAKVLARALRTGEVYIVNEKAAKDFDIKTRETFAAQSRIPEVAVLGGDQDAIKKQLRNEGIEETRTRGRRGQPSRLKGGARPI